MLGCRSRFISCTSRSVFPRLLGSLFIFSTMTCPDCRCRTWGRQGRRVPGRSGRSPGTGPPSSCWVPPLCPLCRSYLVDLREEAGPDLLRAVEIVHARQAGHRAAERPVGGGAAPARASTRDPRPRGPLPRRLSRPGSRAPQWGPFPGHGRAPSSGLAYMAGSPGPRQAALAIGAGPARSGAPGLPLPP